MNFLKYNDEIINLNHVKYFKLRKDLKMIIFDDLELNFESDEDMEEAWDIVLSFITGEAYKNEFKPKSIREMIYG